MAQGGYIYFPLKFSKECFCVSGTDLATTSDSVQCFGINTLELNRFKIYSSFGTQNSIYFRYFSIGI